MAARPPPGTRPGFGSCSELQVWARAARQGAALSPPARDAQRWHDSRRRRRRYRAALWRHRRLAPVFVRVPEARAESALLPWLDELAARPEQLDRMQCAVINVYRRVFLQPYGSIALAFRVLLERIRSEALPRWTQTPRRVKAAEAGSAVARMVLDSPRGAPRPAHDAARRESAAALGAGQSPAGRVVLQQLRVTTCYVPFVARGRRGWFFVFVFSPPAGCTPLRPGRDLTCSVLEAAPHARGRGRKCGELHEHETPSSPLEVVRLLLVAVVTLSARPLDSSSAGTSRGTGPWRRASHRG